MLLLKRVVHLLPAPLHRQLYRLAHAARKQVWKVRKPTVEGVRVLALDVDGKLLLIRHSYGSGAWLPPGGGLERGEDPLAAGPRELFEETGCRLEGARRVAVVDEDLHGASNVVHILVGRTRDTPVPDGREVIEAGTFPLSALPQPMPAGLERSLRGWIEAY